MARPLARCRRSSSSPGVHGLGPGARGLWPGADALSSRHPPSVLYAIVTTAQIQHAAATKAEAQIQDAAATMPNSATMIAVSFRWDDRCATFSGKDHVTVSSRAKIEVATRHGTITVTTTPVPATRNRVRRLPLADAPGGEGPSDEGPSDGPPRRRQRTLHSWTVSSPASSTRSEISTMTERGVIDLNGEGSDSTRDF